MRTTTRIIALIAAVVGSLLSAAGQQQTVEPRPFNNAWSVELGSVVLHDNYLSPLDYSGLTLQLQGAHRGFYRRHIDRLSWLSRNELLLATTVNTAGSASMLMLGGNAAYGTYYHFRLSDNWLIAPGGLVDIGIAGKYNGRNVNNPVSVDASAAISAALLVRYNFRLGRLPVNIIYEGATPLLGAMFVPEYGASYYEFTLSIWDNAFHFAAPHNRYGIRNDLKLDLVFSGFTLRLEMTHNLLHWQANHLQFSKQQLSFGIGTTVDMQLFAGRKAGRYGAAF